MRVFLALMLLAAPLPASAQGRPIPDFDPMATCRAMNQASGAPSQFLLNGCLQNEQRSYDELKTLWPTLTPAMQTTCERIAAVSPSYFLLIGCVRNELRAAEQNQQFQFRR